MLLILLTGCLFGSREEQRRVGSEAEDQQRGVEVASVAAALARYCVQRASADALDEVGALIGGNDQPDVCVERGAAGRAGEGGGLGERDGHGGSPLGMVLCAPGWVPGSDAVRASAHNSATTRQACGDGAPECASHFWQIVAWFELFV
ncbi:MAG: hypothetical protein NZ699_04205 [Roseiflexus sp.]|nr:hypothetical protein [Roseiflexus sp.]MDW8148930.1 hypothetical protein [Roseiflexaceae bacterium]